MPSPDEIDSQQRRLAIYRGNLSHLLERVANGGGMAHASQETANDIRRARAAIFRCKALLRQWGQTVQDQSDDDDPLQPLGEHYIGLPQPLRQALIEKV